MGSEGWGYNSSPGGVSSSTKKTKSKAAGILRVMPCTVSQLLSAREDRDSFFIRDLELNQVTVVGLIRRAKPTTTHVVYSLDDMTGPPIDVKQWQNIEMGFVIFQQDNEPSHTSRDAKLRRKTEFLLEWRRSIKKSMRRFQDVNMNHCVIPPGTYIKAVGSLRSFQHLRSMIAFNIRCLDDFNEITSHMLEVIQAHLYGDSSSYRRNVSLTSTILDTLHASDPATVGFTANQRQVFALIKSWPSAEGISMQCLGNSLKSLSLYDIRTCLQFLINEGHIFSTVDDSHFKCTYD